VTAAGPVTLHIPCDVQQIDQTGHVWAFLDRARVPERVFPGNLVLSGDEDAPVVARVVDLVPITTTDGSVRTVVHLDVLGDPEEYLEVLREYPLTV
jgi:hypothetical protein